MIDGLGGFGLRQTVIQCSGEMAGELPELTRRDQCADRHEAAIARRQIRPQPEIAEENIRCVLRELRRRGAERFFNRSRARLIGLLVGGQKLHVRRRQLLCPDIAFNEDGPRGRNGGHGVLPAGIEGEMRDDP